MFFYNWEFSADKRRWAEVFYPSIKSAEEAYNTYNGIDIRGTTLRFLVKRALNSIWLCGLPTVIYARDLFTTISEITTGLRGITIPKNPEAPGITSLGIAIIKYTSHQHAEEALAILRNPQKLYSHKTFVGRDIQVLWAEPFFDLEHALAQETCVISVSRLRTGTSCKTLTDEFSKCG